MENRHHPNHPDRSMSCEDAIMDADGAWRDDHRDLLEQLARFRVAHEVKVEAHPDEDGPNVGITFLLGGFHGHTGAWGLWNATGGEQALLDALRGLPDGASPEAVTAAVDAGHEAAD